MINGWKKFNESDMDDTTGSPGGKQIDCEWCYTKFTPSGNEECCSPRCKGEYGDYLAVRTVSEIEQDPENIPIS